MRVGGRGVAAEGIALGLGKLDDGAIRDGAGSTLD